MTPAGRVFAAPPALCPLVTVVLLSLMHRTLGRGAHAAHGVSHGARVRLAAVRPAACLLPLSCSLAHTGHMRAVSWVFGLIGGCALIVAVVGNLVAGDLGAAGWVLIGPAPIYAVGLAGAFRGRGHPVAVWLLAGGSLDLLNECLSDIVLPHVGPPAAGRGVLAGMCAGTTAIVTGIGLIGLFPTGRPDRAGQGAVLVIAAALAVLLPVFALIASPSMPPDPYSAPGAASVASPLFQPAVRSLSAVANAAYQSFVALLVLGLIMLYLRYRRSLPSQRRQVRLALVGLAAAMAVFSTQIVVAWVGGEGCGWSATLSVLWIIGLSLLLGALIVALSPEEMLGIDSSARRSIVHSALRALIAVGIVAVAAA